METEGIAERRLRDYAMRRDLRIGRKLGSGIHGVVYEAESNAIPAFAAVKSHRSQTAFARERDAYLRLRDCDVFRIGRLSVPALLGWDDELCTLEMTLVAAPYCLDFAETWLDEPPDFPEQVWQDEATKIEELFGEKASEVQEVLAAFRALGLYVFDVSPRNWDFGD